MLLAFSEQEPEMVINSLQGTGQSFTTHFMAPDVNRAEDEDHKAFTKIIWLMPVRLKCLKLL